MKGKQRTLKIELFKADKPCLNYFEKTPITVVPCSKFRNHELSYSPRSKFLFFMNSKKKKQNSKKNTETTIFNQRID